MRIAIPVDHLRVAIIQQSLYTPLETAGTDYETDLGFPGEYPYTRGIYPSMYQGRLWTMRQYACFGTPEETHKRFRYLLDQGQGGLLVAFDLPTQLGLDSNDPRALAAVLGGVRAALSSTLGQLGEKGFSVFQIDSIKTFSKPVVNGCEQVVCLLTLALGLPQTSEAGGGTEFERFGLLLAGNLKGLVQIGRRSGVMCR